MTALPASLTAAPTTVILTDGEWGNLAEELWLFMEQQWGQGTTACHTSRQCSSRTSKGSTRAKTIKDLLRFQERCQNTWKEVWGMVDMCALFHWAIWTFEWLVGVYYCSFCSLFHKSLKQWDKHPFWCLAHFQGMQGATSSCELYLQTVFNSRLPFLISRCI